MNAWILLAGRVLFALLFVSGGFHHLTNLDSMAQYSASQGVPAPKLAVGVTGLMLLGGGFSILLGFEPRIGALVLVAFLVPAALTMHRFWGLSDPMMAQLQRAHFWKNIALAGAALMIYYFATVYPGAWPYSLS